MTPRQDQQTSTTIADGAQHLRDLVTSVAEVAPPIVPPRGVSTAIQALRNTASFNDLATRSLVMLQGGADGSQCDLTNTNSALNSLRSQLRTLPESARQLQEDVIDKLDKLKELREHVSTGIPLSGHGPISAAEIRTAERDAVAAIATSVGDTRARAEASGDTVALATTLSTITYADQNLSPELRTHFNEKQQEAYQTRTTALRQERIAGPLALAPIPTRAHQEETSDPTRILRPVLLAAGADEEEGRVSRPLSGTAAEDRLHDIAVETRLSQRRTDLERARAALATTQDPDRRRALEVEVAALSSQESHLAAEAGNV